RERGERPSIVAAFSAHDDETTRRRCLEAGFDLYLAKPASREEVFAVLHGHDPADAPSSDTAPLAPDDKRVWIEPWMVPLMPQFLASRLELAGELSAAAEGGDREALRVTAHKLAGSLSMYGFKEASRASRALEQAAASEAFDALQARCESLGRMLAEAQTVVRPQPA
ncbi:MAG TPA: response regulator, partial [Ramlibacter sp.]|nr:response regulator [Ramlibacter sp.]